MTKALLTTFHTVSQKIKKYKTQQTASHTLETNMTGVPSQHCKKKQNKTKKPKTENLVLVGDRTLVPYQMN